MAAMDLGYTNNGFVSDQLIRFYAQRAAGGVGSIIVGGCYTEKRGRMWKGMIGIDHDQYLEGLKRLSHMPFIKKVPRSVSNCFTAEDAAIQYS